MRPEVCSLGSGGFGTMLIEYPSYGADDLRYTYCVGRIRALETRLLSRERLYRMAEAPDVQEILRTLQDTEYGPHLSEISTASQYEVLLSKERRRIQSLYLELSLDPPIDGLLLSRFDFHNLKVLLKSVISEQDFDSALSDPGTIPIQELKGVFSEERYDKLPDCFQVAVEQAVSLYYAKKDPRLIDVAVDRAQFDFQLKRALELQNSFIIGLTRLNIDLVNLLTFYRIKWLEEGVAVLREFLLDGGYLERAFLLSVFEEPWEGLSHSFFVTPYLKIVEQGGSYLRQNSSFARLERLCEDHRMEFLQGTKLLSFGVEPLIAYLLAKETELRSLRMIFVGKLNDIGPALIKERLPITF